MKLSDTSTASTSITNVNDVDKNFDDDMADEEQSSDDSDYNDIFKYVSQENIDYFDEQNYLQNTVTTITTTEVASNQSVGFSAHDSPKDIDLNSADTDNMLNNTSEERNEDEKDENTVDNSR